VQTRFALSSSSVFSRTDTSTDSERFYNSVLELFDDIEEREEVEELLVWWNRCGLLTRVPVITTDSETGIMQANLSELLLSVSSTCQRQCTRQNQGEAGSYPSSYGRGSGQYKLCAGHGSLTKGWRNVYYMYFCTAIAETSPLYDAHERTTSDLLAPDPRT
jgi:hypothetical protein